MQFAKYLVICFCEFDEEGFNFSLPRDALQGYFSWVWRPYTRRCPKANHPIAFRKATDALESKEARNLYFWKNAGWGKGKSMYDININIHSVQSIGNKGGWPITFKETPGGCSQEKANQVLKFLSQEPGLTVSFIGVYNRGKIFVLNKLVKANMPSGLLTHTTGISIILPKIQENVMFLDSAGTERPVKVNELTDRQASQTFLQDLLLSVSDINLFLVNSLLNTFRPSLHQQREGIYKKC